MKKQTTLVINLTQEVAHYLSKNMTREVEMSETQLGHFTKKKCFNEATAKNTS